MQVSDGKVRTPQKSPEANLSKSMKPYSEFNGLINFSKPAGVTSADCFEYVKRLTGARKVGHGGTLDPFARGVLPLGINAGTKKLEAFITGDKSYGGYFRLGYRTDTLDVEGKLEAFLPPEPLNPKILEERRLALLGTYEQQTPRFSARKVGGKKLYQLARGNQPMAIPLTKRITIHELELGPTEADRIHFSVTCSKGTYVRQLVQDLLEGTGQLGTLEDLTRTRVGALESSAGVSYDALYRILSRGEPLSGDWCIRI